MANPLKFKVVVDPKLELQRQLEAAPVENAEALLVAYDILKTAHANGTLDLVNGLVGGRDIIAAKVAEYAKLPGGIAAIRNLLELSKILMAIDPETLDQLTRCVTAAVGQHQAETKPPSLWALARRATSEDSRRGLSFMTLVLAAVGKSLKGTPEK
ncbi:DUF1641 domain-containing protein [Granulicella tundricola]|uniref:DUF1641 domain-containing protein n=1 Tax=Granulicella tundricola (strain ATCC BAA-1859 / DSM 23138 / MP5ACTX9) TaxID=1198114 RepID=E8X3X7_GRATM|nr:DUF1641 domain-containing protein [Granulicella tundricola]ADW70485.1 hypothetical protein AciX9_3480 [Granulicella tundricola MP5ACTX9]